jgi:glycosyltransferase involved in cell wall biosynthesis
MTFLMAEERNHYRQHGLFDVHVVNSAFQRQQVTPQLNMYGDPHVVHVPTPFWADEWKHKPRKRAGEFVIGRLSRSAGDKYSSNTWKIYGKIRDALQEPLRARVMAWSPRLASKLGQPPAWAEALPEKRESAQEFLHSLHCMVHRSGGARENRPRVCLEAMACGVPVVAENECGWPELIKHGKTGFLCDSHDDFVKYVKLLAEDEKLRRKVAKRARRRLSAVADNMAIGEQWVEILEGLQ